MRFIVQGFRLFARERRLWRYAFRPMLASAAVLAVLMTLGFVLLVPLLTSLVRRVGPLERFAEAGGTILTILLVVVTAGVLFIALTGFFSSLLWDRLSLEVERLAGANPTETGLSRAAVVSDSMSRLLFSLLAGVLALCCGWLFWGIPGILLAGLIGLFDFTAPSLLRRGVPFARQRGVIRRLPDWGTFLMGCGLLGLIPLVNVFSLPALVTGGTLMVVEAERRQLLGEATTRPA